MTGEEGAELSRVKGEAALLPSEEGSPQRRSSLCLPVVSVQVHTSLSFTQRFPFYGPTAQKEALSLPDSAFPGQVALKASGRSPPNQGYDLQLSSVLKHFFFPLCDNFKISIIIKKKNVGCKTNTPCGGRGFCF